MSLPFLSSTSILGLPKSSPWGDSKGLTLLLPHSILKMFSADKKRVETALESCGLKFNRVCVCVCGLGWGAQGERREEGSWVLTQPSLAPE